MNVSVKIDMTGFNRGFSLAQEFTKRTPADACNFAAKEVAFAAYKNTPFVTNDKIDSQLDVIVSPVIGKRGKPLKRKKQFSGGGATSMSGVPLAALIVQARARPGSRYNALTGGRYALTQSPFKGVSRAAGQRAMAALVDVMIKSRHRSGHFLAAGWLNSFYKLKSLVPSKYRGSSGLPPATNEGLGDAIPAQPGTRAVCVIENDVGLDNKNPSHNRALITYGSPALQSALDGEGRKQMDYFLSKTGREDLEGPVNRAWA